MSMTEAPPSKPATPTQVTMDPKTRTPIVVQGLRLPMEEILRIKEAGGPLAEVDDLSRMAHAKIAAVEVDGKIVAYWPVWRAVHAEPVWVAEPYRRSPAVIRALIRELEKALDEEGDPIAFAIIEDAQILDSGRYAMRLGFERVPGDLFYVMRQPAAQPVEG